MRCPYCNTEYTNEHPCFCHPAEPKRTASEEYHTKPEEETICVNSHRGVRLD